MNVSVGQRWDKFVENAVKEGRYSSASEVIREGLRMVEERETRLAALRRTIQDAIAAGGDLSDDEITQSLDELEAELARRSA